MARTVTASELGRVMTEEIASRLARLNVLGELLVSQAQKRISEGGDSQHSYPGLWENQWSYRFGGRPLRDTGAGYLALNSSSERAGSNKLTVTLRDGTPDHYMVYHQGGIQTKGPNYIPLTNKGKVGHTRKANPLKEGLVQLMPNGLRRMLDPITGQKVTTDKPPDFMMAWKGVKVPQRKIFNMPPEDLADIVDTVKFAMTGE